MPLFIEIVKRTPPWVFALFLVLLVLGYVQSRDRTVGRRRLLLLPIAMLMLSFYGVVSAFGVTPAGFAPWLLGVMAAVGYGTRRPVPRGAAYSAETQSFSVPGNWLPLALMMGIFFIKYAVGVILARRLPIAGKMLFVGSTSLCYGVFSGAFLARAASIRRCARLAIENPLDASMGDFTARQDERN